MTVGGDKETQSRARAGLNKRSIPGVKNFHPLSWAEQRLIDCCVVEGVARIASSRPSRATRRNTVRGELIRFLALGGDAEAPVRTRGIQLKGAYIIGTLDLENCNISVALSFEKCRFANQVVLHNASVLLLSMSGSAVPTINADRLQCRGTFALSDGFQAEGEVRMRGAEIGGRLDCSGGVFNNPAGNALYLDGIRAQGGIFLADKFSATGEVRLLYARISGVLDCSGGEFTKPGTDVLSLDGAVVGAVHLRNGFSATGQVRFLGALIDGNLDCIDGLFSNPGDICLYGDGAHIRGDVFMRNEFEADGEVRIFGAKIGGDLDCTGGTFSNPSDTALGLDRSKIDGGLFLSQGFDAKGQVRILGGEIGGNLECSDARMTAARLGVLVCEGTAIGGSFILTDAEIDGGISLAGAHAAGLWDDMTSWRPPVVLDGFQYERIHQGATDARTRIDWLKLQQPGASGAKFWPQPWEHLSQVLRSMGHVEDARLVAMEKQRELRRHRIIGSRMAHVGWKRPWSTLDKARVWLINRSARLFHLAYGALAGYGYRPSRTLGWMLIGWALGAAIYHWAEERSLFGPTAPLLQVNEQFLSCAGPGQPGGQAWTRCVAVPPEHAKFFSLVYSLDVILPLIDLRQESEWGPIVHSQDGKMLWDGQLVRAFMWVQILFGWATSLLLVSAAGRLVQKD